MKNFLKYFSILDRVNSVFLLIIFILFLLSLPYSPYSYQPLIVFLFTGTLIFLSVYFRKKGIKEGIIKYFRLFYPLIYLFVIFESFFMILPYLNHNRYDEIFANIDFELLKVHPTVWIEKFVTPLLTDIMYSFYLFYFPMPLFIIVWVYKNKPAYIFDKTVFVFIITYYGAYLVYFMVPTAGPRFYEPLTAIQTKDLNGIFLAVPIRSLINFLEPNKLDAFPSLHAAISFTTILTMAKYNKKMFWIFVPVVTVILISLVYCRYHYVIDIIAGIVWSIIAFVSGHKYYDKFVRGKLPVLFEK